MKGFNVHGTVYSQSCQYAFILSIQKIIPVLMEPKFYHYTKRKIITYYRKSLGWSWCISALNVSPAER